MRVPTIRVVNPADPSSHMTINQADLRDHHEVWPNQAEDFERVRPATAPNADEPVTAIRMIGKVLAQRAGMSVDEWLALPSDDRLARMREAEAEMDAAFAGDRRLRIAKGPRGLWFVRRGTEKVAGGFTTEDEAEAERARLADASDD